MIIVTSMPATVVLIDVPLWIEIIDDWRPDMWVSVNDLINDVRSVS